MPKRPILSPSLEQQFRQSAASSGIGGTSAAPAIIGVEPLTLRLRILAAQHLSKPGEERIWPEMADNYDPQHLLPNGFKAPSLDRTSNVYCVVEAWLRR